VSAGPALKLVEAARPDVPEVSHLVVLGDALDDLLPLRDSRPDGLEQLFAPQVQQPWKLSVVSPEEIAREGDNVSLPPGASHALVCMEGIRAIEVSGLLGTEPLSYEDALVALSLAADVFERQVEHLIYIAQAARIPVVVSTMHPPRYGDQRRQRAVFTALSVFNQRIMRCAFAARVPIVPLALVCTETDDYVDSSRLSKRGLRKVANVVFAALQAASRAGQRSEVFY
jgi:hypothetical protein